MTATTPILTVSTEYKFPGHPDSLSDAIAYYCGAGLLGIDPGARFDIQAAVHYGPLPTRYGFTAPGSESEFQVSLFGQLSTSARPDEVACAMDAAARAAVSRVGYADLAGAGGEPFAVWQSFNSQSPDIIRGIEHGDGQEGAGDATIVHAYASRQTREGLGAAHALVWRLARRLEEAFHSQEVPGLRPDGKVQVDVSYAQGGVFVRAPLRAEAVVVAAQHEEGIDLDRFRRDIARLVRSVNAELVDMDGNALNLVGDGTALTINGTGLFVRGGAQADSGVNGRIDTLYSSGSVRPYGGGLATGRDGTKTDLSCLLMARAIALHLVKGGLAEEAEVSISYAIGARWPSAVTVKAEGCAYNGELLAKAVAEAFDLTPGGIRRYLDLRAQRYVDMAHNGLFGWAGHRWENVEDKKVEILKNALRKSAGAQVGNGSQAKRTLI